MWHLNIWNGGQAGCWCWNDINAAAISCLSNHTPSGDNCKDWPKEGQFLKSDQNYGNFPPDNGNEDDDAFRGIFVAIRWRCWDLIAWLLAAAQWWQFWERSVSELQVASLLTPINHPLLLPRLCLTHSTLAPEILKMPFQSTHFGLLESFALSSYPLRMNRR